MDITSIGINPIGKESAKALIETTRPSKLINEVSGRLKRCDNRFDLTDKIIETAKRQVMKIKCFSNTGKAFNLTVSRHGSQSSSSVFKAASNSDSLVFNPFIYVSVSSDNESFKGN